MAGGLSGVVWKGIDSRCQPLNDDFAPHLEFLKGSFFDIAVVVGSLEVGYSRANVKAELVTYTTHMPLCQVPRLLHISGYRFQGPKHY